MWKVSSIQKKHEFVDVPVVKIKHKINQIINNLKYDYEEMRSEWQKMSGDIYLDAEAECTEMLTQIKALKCFIDVIIRNFVDCQIQLRKKNPHGDMENE